MWRQLVFLDLPTKSPWQAMAALDDRSIGLLHGYHDVKGIKLLAFQHMGKRKAGFRYSNGVLRLGLLEGACHGD